MIGFRSRSWPLSDLPATWGEPSEAAWEAANTVWRARLGAGELWFDTRGDREGSSATWT